MKTLIAKYNDYTVYIHYVSKFLEYALVSREEGDEKKFKVNIPELIDVTEQDLLKKLREQELQEQEKKGTH